jgi:hypothetical protein
MSTTRGCVRWFDLVLVASLPLVCTHLLEHEEKVHGPTLGNLVIVTPHPQDLVVPHRHRLLCRFDCWPVVSPELKPSDSPRPGPLVDAVSVEGDGLETLGVVGADWRGDHEQLDVSGDVNSKEGVRADGSGTEVERVPGALRNPALLNLAELLEQGRQLTAVKGGHGEAIH